VANEATRTWEKKNGNIYAQCTKILGSKVAAWAFLSSAGISGRTLKTLSLMEKRQAATWKCKHCERAAAAIFSESILAAAAIVKLLNSLASKRLGRPRTKMLQCGWRARLFRPRTCVVWPIPAENTTRPSFSMPLARLSCGTRGPLGSARLTSWRCGPSSQWLRRIPFLPALIG
jgi:hypothetical protein